MTFFAIDNHLKIFEIYKLKMIDLSILISSVAVRPASPFLKKFIRS